MDIASITTGVTALANLALVSPQNTIGYQPQQAGSTKPLGDALVFQYEGENTVTLDADITDHPVEDNTTQNDQIALKPEIITVHGFMGELTNTPPNKTFAALKTVSQKLVTIGAYAPELSATAVIAYNEALLAYQLADLVANTAVSALDTLTGSGGQAVVGNNGISNTDQRTQGKQQIMFQKFYGYFRARKLFTVQTPWAIFQNCAIKSIRAVQDAESKMITDFEIQFKVMRFATTDREAGTFTQESFQGQAAAQAAPEVDYGLQPAGPSTPFGIGAA